MHYESHAWARGRDSCEVYVRLADGRPPSAGETVIVDTGECSAPLRIESSRWLDEQAGGVLVLTVLRDQEPTVNLLTKGMSIRRDFVSMKALSEDFERSQD